MDYFKDLVDAKSKMPENFEEFFISNIKSIMKETFKQDKEFSSFIDGFITECGKEILEYNLETFTKEEIWKNVLLCQTPEYIKLLKFQSKYTGFLMNLFQEYSDEQDKKKHIDKKEKEMNDEWTTE